MRATAGELLYKRIRCQGVSLQRSAGIRVQAYQHFATTRRQHALTFRLREIIRRRRIMMHIFKPPAQLVLGVGIQVAQQHHQRFKRFIVLVGCIHRLRRQHPDLSMYIPTAGMPFAPSTVQLLFPSLALGPSSTRPQQCKFCTAAHGRAAHNQRISQAGVT